jgi:predicted GNAT superfamily acetyltransferase
VNVYGDSISPLHKGAPTDRFIAQWWMRSPRVEAALSGAPTPGAADPGRDVPVVNAVERQGDWLACTRIELDRREPSLAVTIPSRFPEMLVRQADAARAWRLATREIFLAYFSRGYRVTDFSSAPGSDRGTYLLEAGAFGP